MTSIMKVQPMRFPSGPVQAGDLNRSMVIFHRDVLRKMDLLESNQPTGRTVGVPTLVQKITDGGTAQDQRFLPQVSAGNKLSVQNVLPLTATANASTATISIAAHTLQYGWGAVSYSSGTISGLAPNTAYYVYADDPNFTGGAVTYVATTNPQTVTANNGRYYVGSILTAIAATVENISAASSTNPISFTTSSAHGWSSADQVTFASLPGDFGSHLNGTTKSITVTGANTFTVAIDGTTYVAYTTGGTATRVSSATSGGGGGGGGGGFNFGGRLP